MKITAISSKTEALEDLRMLLNGYFRGDELRFLKRNGGQLHPEGSSAEASEVLLLDIAEPGGAVLAEVAALTGQNPNLAVILLSATRSPDLLIGAMRAGVREVLTAPVSRDDLLEAIERARGRLTGNSGDKARGKILAFVSSKGGSGATFVATNLGYALATQHDKKVILIDLDFQYGDASFFVADARPVSSIAEVARRAERLDATVLASSCIEVAPNYSLLPAPEDPEKAMGLRPDDIERLLAVAAANYDFVIVDIERSVDAVSIRALDRADLVFLVMQPMVQYVRDAQRLLALFRTLGYGNGKVHVLGNRSDSGSDLPAKAIEQSLGVKLYRMLPNDFEHAKMSVNLGTPVLKLAPKCPVARALSELADDLAGATRNSESWLGRFFHLAHN